MTRFKKLFFHFLLLALIALSLNLGASARKSDIVLEDFWVRAVPSVSKVSAAFGVIKNNTKRERMLVSVEADISEFVELHTHKKHKKGRRKVLKMRKVDFIKIPAKESVELKRLSYHIMLINLKHKLELGQKFKMRFRFDDGTEIQALVPVKKY